MIKGLIARKLLRLVAKYGMKFVLQGLIEICEHGDDERFEQLATDLQVALDNFEGKGEG